MGVDPGREESEEDSVGVARAWEYCAFSLEDQCIVFALLTLVLGTAEDEPGA